MGIIISTRQYPQTAHSENPAHYIINAQPTALSLINWQPCLSRYLTNTLILHLLLLLEQFVPIHSHYYTNVYLFSYNNFWGLH